MFTKEVVQLSDSNFFNEPSEKLIFIFFLYKLSKTPLQQRAK